MNISNKQIKLYNKIYGIMENIILKEFHEGMGVSVEYLKNNDGLYIYINLNNREIISIEIFENIELNYDYIYRNIEKYLNKFSFQYKVCLYKYNLETEFNRIINL